MGLTFEKQRLLNFYQYLIIMKIKEEYDVIIIGAGPAGLECAKTLINSNLSVLLINKDKVHKKVCCNYLPIRDLKILPKKIINHNFPFLEIDYHGIQTSFDFKNDKVYVTDRKIIFNEYSTLIKKSKNVDYLGGIYVSRVFEDYIVLENGNKIKFKFIVGADGSNSIVRNYLKIPSKKVLFAIQYPSKKNFKNIKVFFDNEVFPGGYGWIGAHKNYTVIGGGLLISESKNFKQNIENWIRKNKFDVKWKEIQSCILNCDYQGYKFNNFFLAGDAAGLVSALTGEGIYPALLSGRQVAYDLLGIKKNILKSWLINKRFQDYAAKFANKLPNSKIVLNLLIAIFGRTAYKFALT